ncbi:hypothetical protein TrLO_g12899 [Triparma laevis f. longispina]|uniref:Uncharacterized protein n=1 Tax=Triparma laevis f. longispina TaxID=1714387 RepID=A0A9W7KYS4_9STRA|nr:hypothetical protein TrLO_g12899 [Triparma laevis f. longispina]
MMIDEPSAEPSVEKKEDPPKLDTNDIVVSAHVSDNVTQKNGEDVLGEVGTGAVRTILKWAEGNDSRYRAKLLENNAPKPDRESQRQHTTSDPSSSSSPTPTTSTFTSTPRPPKYTSLKLHTLLTTHLTRLIKSKTLSPPPHVYFSPRDSAPQIIFFSGEGSLQPCKNLDIENKSNMDMLQIGSSKGYRMSRATVGVQEGKFYWECEVVNGGKEVRIKSEDEGDVESCVRLGEKKRLGGPATYMLRQFIT